MPLGDSDKVLPGHPIAAIGAPFGNEESLSTGTISAIRSIGSKINVNSRIAGALQTDAAINRGNSGGPMFNARGEVIGINQQINTTSGSSAGVGYAIPVNTAKRALEMIKETGSVRWAHLGVRTETVTPQLARQQGLPATHGALVQHLDPGSAAERAGLSAQGKVVFHLDQDVVLGDLIVKIAGADVRDKDDVTLIMSRVTVGQRVEIVYFRNGERQTATAIAGEKPLNG